MNKARQNRARRAGMTSRDIACIEGIALKNAKAMEKQCTEKAFLYMLAIPLNVLVADEMITHENAEDYINDVISLYQSVEAGVVSDEQLADLLKEYAGLTVEAKWLHKESDRDANRTN